MSHRIADRILNYVGTQRDFFIRLLRRLVEAESPSSFPDIHDEVRHIISMHFDQLGFIVHETGSHRVPRHIYARPRQRQHGMPIQLLIGHFDTVWPPGTVTERPFTVDANVIHGPGVFDMKGGIVQILVALKAIQALGLEPTLTPVIFLNADEEIGSRTSTHYICMLARRASRAFILEPAMGEDGALKTERKGIGRFTVTVHGKAAHAGLDPESGASAILELSHVIQKLFSLNDADRGITVNVGNIDGGVHPNIIAAHSSAIVDVRVPNLEEGDRIEKIIHGIEPSTPGVRLHIEGRIGRPSMEATPRNRALWHSAERSGEELGLQLRSSRAGGGSDGNTTSRFTATLDGLGPVGDGAHAEHEFLYIDRTLERAALLAMLLLSPIERRSPADREQ